MFFYFIIFSILGFVIGKLNNHNESQAFVIILIIAILWGISSAFIWGLVSLGEMALGYFISRIIK